MAAAVAALRDRDAVVLARPSVLLASGPGWFNRVIEAASPTSPPPGLADAGLNPFRWPGWLWGVLAGLGLIVAGIGAAAITLGPVLLSYDRSYLGLGVDDLRQINGNLVHFIQHDRISMAGNMIGLGALSTGLSPSQTLSSARAKPAPATMPRASPFRLTAMPLLPAVLNVDRQI